MPLELTMEQAIPNAIFRNTTLYERTVYGSSRKTTKAKKKAGRTAVSATNSACVFCELQRVI